MLLTQSAVMGNKPSHARLGTEHGTEHGAEQDLQGIEAQEQDLARLEREHDHVSPRVHPNQSYSSPRTQKPVRQRLLDSARFAGKPCDLDREKGIKASACTLSRCFSLTRPCSCRWHEPKLYG